MATRGHETAYGADLEAPLGLGDLGRVGSALPACSKARRVYAVPTPGRRSGRVIMVGLPSSSVFVQRGKPFVPSRAWDEGTPVAGVEELSVGRLARRTTTQHAPRAVGSARRQPSKGAHRWMSGQRQQASSGQASGPVKSADGKRRWRGCAGCWPARMRNGGRGGGRGSGGRRLQRAAAPGYGVGDWAGQPCSQQAGVSYTDINSMASRLLCADESDALAKAPSQLARLCEAQRSGAAAATGGSGEWMAMEGGPARLDWQRW